MSDLLNHEGFFGRSLDTIYCNAKIETAPDGEKFRCGVCHKEYKTKKGAEKHLAKRNCHSAVDVFADTEFENVMRMMYRCMTNKNAEQGIVRFRHLTAYKSVAKLGVYLMTNLRFDMFERYIIYIKGRYKIPNNNGVEMVNYICHIGMKESTLTAFRQNLLKRQEAIPPPNQEMLQTLQDDPHQFLRALEKCELSLSDAEEYFDLDSLIDRMSEAQKIRLEEVCYQIEYANM